MRNVSVASRVVALVAVFSVSAIGQQSPSITLPAEAASTQSVVTLAGAASHNDFPLFDAMFNNATRSEATRFAELHSFWKWSLTDPIGAFYGDEMHAKFASEYPGYAEYIAEYGIIDSHGRAFYPSSETRTFLLRQAILGRSPAIELGERASRPHVAAVPAGTQIAKVTHKVKPAATVKPAARSAQPRPIRVAHAKPAVLAPAVVPNTVVAAPKVVAPIVAPTTVAIVTPKVVAAPKAIAAPKVAVTPKTAAATPARVAPKTDARLGRGLLLILAGLVGLGMLSLMLHAPSEEPVAETRDQAHPLEPSRMIQLDQKPKKTA